MRFVCLTALFFLFTHLNLKAQNCTGCTITNTILGTSNTGHDLANNAVLCLTGSGTYTGNININGDNVTICIDENVKLTNGFNPKGNTTVNNYGEVNLNSFTVDGLFNNYGTLHVGSLGVNSSGSLNHQGDSLYAGSMGIDGDVVIQGNATIAGSLTVNGSGDLNIQDGIVDVGGAFQNNGVVSAAGSSSCGGMNIGGATVNNGGASYGADGSPLDFCDPDGSFDVQNGTVGAGVSACSCNPTTLPIELVLFSASKYSTYNQLNWLTASETNNSHFIIEKSTDGEVFQAIGEVQGAGSVKSSSNYSFIDLEIEESVIYYRLRQIDFDETESFSRIVVIQRDAVSIPIIEYHAERQEVTIKYNEGIKMEFRLYSMSGKAIDYVSIVNDSYINISTENLSTGIYILKCMSNSRLIHLEKLLIR